MVDSEEQVGFLVVLVVLVVLILAIRKYLQYKKKMFMAALQERHHNEASQQPDIYSISNRIQGQQPGTWPTHNAHVSLDHFTIANEQNKYNDAPPSYEEAVSVTRTNGVPVPVVAVPKISVTNLPPPYSSTNTSTTN